MTAPVTPHGATKGFVAVRECFARACDRGDAIELDLSFAGANARLLVAGDALGQVMQAAFAHLRVPAQARQSQLTIELWDVREHGVPPPDESLEPAGQGWDLGAENHLAMSADRRFIQHEVRGSVAWLDRRDGRIAGWIADARDLSLHQRARPLQLPLAIWVSDRDLHPVHAALVGRGERGLLLAGRGGCGKSSTALAALESGWRYVADDWVALGQDHGVHVGYGLYATACLESQHADQCFAALRPERVRASEGLEPKSLMLLGETAPARLAAALPLAAVVLPRVVEHRDSRIRPASKREALLTIVPSSIFTMSPRGGRADTERLFEVAAQVPAFWLDIGRDLEQIPRRLDDILAAAAAA